MAGRIIVIDDGAGKVFKYIATAPQGKPDPRIEELVNQAEKIKPGSGDVIRRALQGPINVPFTPGIPATPATPETRKRAIELELKKAKFEKQLLPAPIADPKKRATPRRPPTPRRSSVGSNVCTRRSWSYAAAWMLRRNS